jgi:hypothetical protein
MRSSIGFSTRLREIKSSADGGMSAKCVMLEEGPGNEVDGHYYLASCLEDAAESGVFEGAQAYADHDDDEKGRSVHDLIGWWSDVHCEESKDGHKLLVGTFNVERGNEWALNKMREAKRYAARYADQPEKQYVGFSIAALGISESREIDGKTYSAVIRITEAGSTDMVTRAGAGGKMLSLKEAYRTGARIRESDASDPGVLKVSGIDGGRIREDAGDTGILKVSGVADVRVREAAGAEPGLLKVRGIDERGTS